VDELVCRERYDPPLRGETTPQPVMAPGG